ncbi:MAG: tRNA (5-methylaminomethyl-2-thiouridine)(34)-methyltransferase MnmD [Sphingomonadaceae bacterium]
MPVSTDPQAEFSAGILRSARFGDIYFSTDGGLAETRTVFLAGCGLPDAWRNRRHFSVAELGFGSGLNMLATLALWRDTRPADGYLQLFSVEGFPLAAADIKRALATFPELADLAQPLLRHWPDGARGLHRIAWPELHATLDLAIMEAEPALAAWDGRADAWFLDGFAPARNPAMWSEPVLAAVAAHTAPGGRLATYTVAGDVRRGLAAHGFAVERLPGFGRKRQRLEARFPGSMEERPVPVVAIIGAGVSGAALALAFRRLGVEARVYASGSMASGNPAALLSPRIDAGGGAPAMLYAQAFRHAVDLVRETAPRALLAEGAIRLEVTERDAARFATAAASPLFDRDALQPLDAADVAFRCSESASPPGLWMPEALTIAPAELRRAWLLREPVDRRIDAVEARAGGGWKLFSGGAMAGEADILVVAAGAGTTELTGLPLRQIRGQASFADVPFSGTPATWGHYCIPTATGLLFGATHDRDDSDAGLRDTDHERNLAELAVMRPSLAEQLRTVPLSGSAGVRVAPRDTRPVAGHLGDGCYVLTGLGGRGFALAPLLAAHVAAMALGCPSPLPRDLALLVDPWRLL